MFGFCSTNFGGLNSQMWNAPTGKHFWVHWTGIWDFPVVILDPSCPWSTERSLYCPDDWLVTGPGYQGELGLLLHDRGQEGVCVGLRGLWALARPSLQWNVMGDYRNLTKEEKPRAQTLQEWWFVFPARKRPPVSQGPGWGQRGCGMSSEEGSYKYQPQLYSHDRNKDCSTYMIPLPCWLQTCIH